MEDRILKRGQGKNGVTKGTARDPERFKSAITPSNALPRDPRLPRLPEEIQHMIITHVISDSIDIRRTKFATEYLTYIVQKLIRTSRTYIPTIARTLATLSTEAEEKSTNANAALTYELGEVRVTHFGIEIRGKLHANSGIFEVEGERGGMRFKAGTFEQFQEAEGLRKVVEALRRGKALVESAERRGDLEPR